MKIISEWRGEKATETKLFKKEYYIYDLISNDESMLSQF